MGGLSRWAAALRRLLLLAAGAGLLGTRSGIAGDGTAPPAPADSALVAQLADPAKHDAAAEALVARGAKAVPALVAVFRDAKLRALAIPVLERMGPDAAPAVPQLIAVVGVRGSPVRVAAARALAAIGREAAQATGPLHAWLRDPAAPGRDAAAAALGRIVVSELELVPMPKPPAPPPATDAETRILAGADWLVRHQNVDGHWSAAGFVSACQGRKCDGAASEAHDVGVTGLAVQALLGAGDRGDAKARRSAADRGVTWLVRTQRDDGYIGPTDVSRGIYDHLCAMLALSAASRGDTSNTALPALAKALRLLVAARDRHGGGWKYALDGSGGSDTSVTTWAVRALDAATEVGVGPAPEALRGALGWVEKRMVRRGRLDTCEYDHSCIGAARYGERSAAMFPAIFSAGPTAGGLLVREIGGQAWSAPPLDAPDPLRTVTRCPPKWDEDLGGIDLDFWLHGTLLLKRLGGANWTQWQASLHRAAADGQEPADLGCCRGSWGPVDVWGESCGRVYTTAMMVLALEVTIPPSKPVELLRPLSAPQSELLVTLGGLLQDRDLVLRAAAKSAAQEIRAARTRADPAPAADPPAAPASVLRFAPPPGKEIGFKLRSEGSSEVRMGSGGADPARRSHFEMDLALEGAAPGADGAVEVKLRIARVSGRSTRLGLGSFEFDSESEPPADVLQRNVYYGSTALAGTQFTVSVASDGAVSNVSGIDAARKLALGRAGSDPLFSLELERRVSEESVRGLVASVLGPAPFPKAALATSSSWTDEDAHAASAWDTDYRFARTFRPTEITRDSVKLAGKGTPTLVRSADIALLPLTVSAKPDSSGTSEWTIGTADGLPVTGLETATFEGSVASKGQTVSTRHQLTWVVARLAAPPPAAVRPLTGSQDIDRLREKEDAAARAARDERKKERQRQGTRGAWCVSADGSLLAAGTPDCHVEVWRADGTAPIAVLKGHTDLVCDVAFTSGGKTVYACADDGTVRGWKVESGEQVAHLGKPYETSEFSGGRLPRGYQQIESSADGRYLVLAGALRVSVWDAQGKGWTDVPPALPYARHLRFGGDPRHVVIAAHDRLARFDLQAAPTRSTSFTDPKKEYVWLEPSWQRQRPVLSGTSELPDDLGAGPLADVVVLDLPSLVVTLHSVGFLEKDEKPRLRAWDLRTGERRWEVEAPSGRLMPAPKTAVLALADRGVLRILAPGDGKVVMTVKIPSGREVRALAPDASAWYDAEKDGTLVRVPIVGDATGGK